MALTISQFATGSRTTSGASVVLSGLTASVGDMLIVGVSADNDGTSGVASLTGVSDSASNTWTEQSKVNRTPTAAASDGVTLGIYTSRLTAALSSGSITVAFSPSTDNVNVLVWRVQPETGEYVSVRSVAAGASGAGTSGTITTASAPQGATVFGFTATEGGEPYTADSDTTRGSWSSNYVAAAAGATTTIASQHKTVDDAGTQTYNTSWSSSTDYAINALVIAPAVRLYLPSSSSAPAISPSADAGWEQSSEMDRIIASTSKTSSAMTTATSTKTTASTAFDIVRRQFVYGPLAGGTLAGDVLGVIRVYEGALSGDGTSQLVIRVIAPDGTTVRGTALALSSGALANEWSATTLTNRFFPLGTAAAALTDVTVTAGDYLVLEVGVRSRENSASARTFQWRFGDAAGTDAAENQTATTDNNPWIDLYGSVPPLLTLVTDTDDANAKVTELDSVAISATDTDSAAANVTETESVIQVVSLTDTDSAAANVTETETVAQTAAFTDTDNAAANVDEADSIAINATDLDSANAKTTELDSVAITATDLDSVSVSASETDSVLVVGDFPPLGLRVDVYQADGTKRDGFTSRVLSASYTLNLDQIGSFSLDVPADDTSADLFELENEVRIYRESEGLVFRGIIARRVQVVADDGSRVLRLTGDSIARQLVKLTTGLGLAFQGDAVADVIDDLLDGTGWTAGTVPVTANLVTARFDGVTRWEALTKIADLYSWHVRENNLTRQIDLVTSLAADSGLTFANVPQWTPELADNDSLFPVTSVDVDSQSEDLINRLIPIGAGEGVNALTLRYATRTSPYTVETDTGPDGRPFWYIQDDASVSAYGVSERVVSVKDAIPLANSAAGFIAASNALYDVAATALSRSANPLTSYSVSVAGLRHVVSNAPLVVVGETVRLLYRGIAADADSPRTWLDVDESLYLMGFSRSFDAAGADSWSLTLNTVDRFDVDPGAQIAQTFQAIQALQVAMRNYTYNEVHILERTMVEDTFPATMIVDWDPNVAMLHKARLSISVREIRRDVKLASSGGGSTSSSAGGQTPTSSSGGGQTSSSGGSHSHSMSGTADAGGNHRHLWATNDGGGTVYTTDNSAGHTHNYSNSPPSTTGDNSVVHNHNFSFGEIRTKSSGTVGSTSTVIGDWVSVPGGSMYTDDSSTHTHDLTGATASSGGSHTHTVSNHTHTVTVDAHSHTVSAHTHNLEYGVNIGSLSMSGDQLSISINGVDVTTALGGPWDVFGGIGEVELDVTAYLQDDDTEIPIQASNQIELSIGMLSDVSAILRSLVTATSLVPV